MASVDIPAPAAPDAEGIVDKLGDLGGFLTSRGSAFWSIVISLVLALVVMSLLKRAFVRGLVVAAIIVSIVFVAFII